MNIFRVFVIVIALQTLLLVGAVRIKFYGNWCGPCHPKEHCETKGRGKFPKKPCLDALDCACKSHDYCYRVHGVDICQCDNVFIRRLSRVQSSKRVKKDVRLTAYLFKKAFRVKPCRAPVTKRRFVLCKKCRGRRGAKVRGTKKCACLRKKCKIERVNPLKKGKYRKYKC